MRLLRTGALLLIAAAPVARAQQPQQAPPAASVTGVSVGPAWLRTYINVSGRTQLDSVLVNVLDPEIIGWEHYTSTNPLKTLAQDTIRQGEARCAFLALKTKTGYLTGIHYTNTSSQPTILFVGVNQATDGTLCPAFPKDTTFDPRLPAAALLTVKKAP